MRSLDDTVTEEEEMTLRHLAECSEELTKQRRQRQKLRRRIQHPCKTSLQASPLLSPNGNDGSPSGGYPTSGDLGGRHSSFELGSSNMGEFGAVTTLNQPMVRSLSLLSGATSPTLLPTHKVSQGGSSTVIPPLALTESTRCRQRGECELGNSINRQRDSAEESPPTKVNHTVTSPTKPSRALSVEESRAIAQQRIHMWNMSNSPKASHAHVKTGCCDLLGEEGDPSTASPRRSVVGKGVSPIKTVHLLAVTPPRGEGSKKESSSKLSSGGQFGASDSISPSLASIVQPADPFGPAAGFSSSGHVWFAPEPPLERSAQRRRQSLVKETSPSRDAEQQQNEVSVKRRISAIFSDGYFAPATPSSPPSHAPPPTTSPRGSLQPLASGDFSPSTRGSLPNITSARSSIIEKRQRSAVGTNIQSVGSLLSDKEYAKMMGFPSAQAMRAFLEQDRADIPPGVVHSNTKHKHSTLQYGYLVASSSAIKSLGGEEAYGGLQKEVEGEVLKIPKAAPPTALDLLHPSERRNTNEEGNVEPPERGYDVTQTTVAILADIHRVNYGGSHKELPLSPLIPKQPALLSVRRPKLSATALRQVSGGTTIKGTGDSFARPFPSAPSSIKTPRGNNKKREVVS